MSYPVKEGDILAGKYKVESVLGKGGMGVVVAATHLQLKERVALKFLLPQASTEPEFAARFQREAQFMAKLRGEHVVRVSDVGVLETGSPYMVMEFLEGTDLRDVIREINQLPLDVAIDYFLQACEGVAEAHSLGIVHRDLKPTNLFVTQRRDGSPLVKVLDFGISKIHGDGEDEDDQLTGAATVLGSPKYMPPEQLRSSRDVDHRADVWALGAILQELLTGAPPFAGPTTTALCAAIISDPPQPLRQRRPDLPEALEQVMLRCFEKDRDQRFQNVAELVSEIVLAACPEDATALLSVERIARLHSTPSLSLTSGRAAVLARSGASPLLGQTSTNPSISRTGLYTPSQKPESSPSGHHRVTHNSTSEVSMSASGRVGSLLPPSQTQPNHNKLFLGFGILGLLLGAGAFLFRPRVPPSPSTPISQAKEVGSKETPSALPSPPTSVISIPTSSASSPIPSSSTTVEHPPSASESPPSAPEHGKDVNKKKGGTIPRGYVAPPPVAPPVAPPPATKEKPVANPLEDRH